MIFRKRILFLSFVALCFGLPVHAQLHVFPESYHRAIAWQTRGWHKAAVQVFDSLLDKRQDPEYLRNSVQSYLALQLPDSAQKRMEQYPLQKYPAYALLKAEIACYTEQFQEGINSLGIYLQNRYKLSEQELMRDTLLRPCQETPAWDSLWRQQYYTSEQQSLNYLEYLAYKGDWQLLLEELDGQYARNAKRHEYAYLRALALRGIGDLKSALLAAEVATDQRSHDVRYGMLRAQLMLTLGYKRQAEALILDLQKRDKFNPAFLPLLAQTQYAIGRTDAAYATAQRYLDYYPQDTAALYCAAWSAASSKRITQSLNLIARLYPVADTPMQIALQRLRADLLVWQGDYRQALVDYKEALTHTPQDTLLLRHAAETCFALRDTVEGCRLAQRAQEVGHLQIDRLLRRYCTK